MKRNEQQPHRALEGQVLILVAIGSLVLLAFAALAVDAGLALSERRGAQNAADAASLAAARAMVDGESNQTVLRAMAQHYAQLNGYEIADPPNDVRFPNAETVEVDIHHDVPRVFLGAFYDGDWAVRTTATASLDTVPADYGLITLDETGNGIYLDGNTHLTVAEGGMMSNSGISCAGSSTITADTAVHAAGTILDTSNPSIACHIAGGSDTSGGRPTIDDPLAGTPSPPNPFPPPSLGPGACVGLNFPDPWNPMIECSPGRYTSWSGPQASGYGLRLLPGTYYFDGANFTTNPWGTGQIEVVAGGTYNFYIRNATFSVNNARLNMGSTANVNMYLQNSTLQFTGSTDVVTLGSGLYYFDNSTFNIASGSGARGTGVSFFFRNGGAFRSTGNTHTADFTAPTTPLYPGMPPNMLFHAEAGSNTVIDIGAYSRAMFDGIVYGPNSTVLLTGNVDGVWARGQMIVGRFRAHGSLGTAANPSTIEYHQYVEMGTPQVWLIR